METEGHFVLAEEILQNTYHIQCVDMLCVQCCMLCSLKHTYKDTASDSTEALQRELDRSDSL